MKMETIGDFINALSATMYSTATVSIQMWKEDCQASEWEECVNAPLSTEGLLSLRDQMSQFYADRLNAVSDEVYYDEILLEHMEFIQEFDSIAAEQGYIITEPRKSISLTESFGRSPKG